MIKELPDYESKIQDDPIELLKAIENQVHVPDRAVYPTLTIIEAMISLLSIRQGEKEGLLSYLERYKSEKNVVEGLVGKGFLNEFLPEQLVLCSVSWSSAAGRRTHREPTRTNIARPGGEKTVASQARQGGVLGGGESHGVVVNHHL